MEKLKKLSTCIYVAILFISGCASKEERGPSSARIIVADQQNIPDDENLKFERLKKDVSKKLELIKTSNGQTSTFYLANDLFFKASAATMEGDYKTAAYLYESLLTLEPNDSFLKKKYAICLIRLGELDKSVPILDELAHEDGEDRVNLALILAGVYGTLGKTNQAVSVYKEVLASDPGNEDACVFYSKVLAADKEYKKAIGELKKCSKLNKKKGIFDYYIGKLYVDQADLKNAQKAFRDSFEKESGFSQSVMALGLIYEELKQNKKALKLYEDHLKEKPDDSLILGRIVQLLFTTQDYDKVIRYAERLSDTDPDDLNLKVKLGVLYTDKGDYNKAVSIFKELLQHNPENDNILYYVGAIYQQLGHVDNAIDYYSKIDTQSQLYEDSSMQIAKMLGSQAEQEFVKHRKMLVNTKKFLSYVESASGSLPKLTLEFQTLKAGFFETTGNYGDAINVMSKMKDHQGFNDTYTFYLASLYEKVKDYEQSSAVVMELLSKDPKNAHAWNYLGYSLLERGEHIDLAHQYIVKALTLKPHDGYIRDSLGWYYCKIGKYDSALSELLYANEKVGEDFAIQKHLSIVYSKMKKFEKAKEWLVKALANTNDEKETKELKNLMIEVEGQRIPASNN